MQVEEVKGLSYYWNHRLGEGEFGKIYKGRWQNKDVAVKIIEKHLLKEISGINVELKFLEKKLQHDNLVNILASGQSDRRIILVMELCDGGDLLSRLKNQGALPENEVIRILFQISSALGYLHKNGIIHRDVKPANILFHKNGYKLGDFGIAAMNENPSKSSPFPSAGSPAYLSPQALLEQPYSAKCDVWSLGVMIYQLLYGSLPWKCSSLKEELGSLMNELNFPPNPEVSPWLQNIIRQCLEVREDRRISMEGLYESVRQYFNFQSPTSNEKFPIKKWIKDSHATNSGNQPCVVNVIHYSPPQNDTSSKAGPYWFDMYVWNYNQYQMICILSQQNTTPPSAMILFLQENARREPPPLMSPNEIQHIQTRYFQNSLGEVVPYLTRTFTK